jgi:multidrug efflux system membrane fusion protein
MRSSRSWWSAVLALVILAGILWAWRSRTAGAAAASAAGGQAARPLAVTVAAVEQRDLPVYLEGLGAVVANRTVTIRTQVDGRLDQVLFREGQAVRAGQVLAQIDPRPYQIQLLQAQGAQARDQAQLDNARLTVKRDQQLIADHLIAPQQLDTDQAAAAQLEGVVRIDEAALQSARLALDYARVTSPIDGVTGVRLVDQGNFVRASDAGGLVVITELDPVAVIFSLPQDDLLRVSAQMGQGDLPVEAFARDGTTLLGTGKLALIDNQINQATSTLRLKATLPNPQHRLWPNQFVKARLRLSTRRGALVIPASAVQRGPSGPFVYVVDQGQVAAVRPVQVTPPQGDLAIVESGLAAGERVVADGQDQLRPGAKVAPREAASPATAASPAAAAAVVERGGGTRDAPR